MLRFALVSSAIAATFLSAPAQAQQTPTYYYCYAHESDGSNLWVSQVRHGDRDSYANYVSDYRRKVQDAYNVHNFRDVSCTPFNENDDRDSVESERSVWLNMQRNSEGRNVIFFD